jgi:hypothetical protein
MNKFICFSFGNSHGQTGLARSIRFALIGALILGCLPLASAYAQNTNSITEYVPTFLEQQLEERDPTLNVRWNWSKVEDQRHAYEISISSPTTWASARFCVDGEQSKAIALSTPQFLWSFKSLSVGKHTASLLITDDEGNIGVVHRPIRIR